MIIKQHIPNDVYYSVNPLIHEAYDIEGLLNIDWINKWKDDPDFYRFSLCFDKPSTYLMVELKEGKEWWVVGYINDLIKDHNLPIWQQRKDVKHG